jgi:predicted N-acetyltransferase YhbS
LDTCWVAEADGRLVGGFRLYPLQMHLWGNRYSVQGLAAVAVSPEMRRKGIGRQMCVAALQLGK